MAEILRNNLIPRSHSDVALWLRGIFLGFWYIIMGLLLEKFFYRNVEFG